jgi:hypothetical protein
MAGILCGTIAAVSMYALLTLVIWEPSGPCTFDDFLGALFIVVLIALLIEVFG